MGLFNWLFNSQKHFDDLVLDVEEQKDPGEACSFGMIAKKWIYIPHCCNTLHEFKDKNDLNNFLKGRPEINGMTCRLGFDENTFLGYVISDNVAQILTWAGEEYDYSNFNCATYIDALNNSLLKLKATDYDSAQQAYKDKKQKITVEEIEEAHEYSMEADTVISVTKNNDEDSQYGMMHI